MKKSFIYKTSLILIIIMGNSVYSQQKTIKQTVLQKLLSKKFVIKTVDNRFLIINADTIDDEKEYVDSIKSTICKVDYDSVNFKIKSNYTNDSISWKCGEGINNVNLVYKVLKFMQTPITDVYFEKRRGHKIKIIRKLKRCDYLEINKYDNPKEVFFTACG